MLRILFWYGTPWHFTLRRPRRIGETTFWSISPRSWIQFTLLLYCYLMLPIFELVVCCFLSSFEHWFIVPEWYTSIVCWHRRWFSFGCIWVMHNLFRCYYFSTWSGSRWRCTSFASCYWCIAQIEGEWDVDHRTGWPRVAVGKLDPLCSYSWSCSSSCLCKSCLLLASLRKLIIASL